MDLWDFWWDSFRAWVGGATPQRRPGILVTVRFASDGGGTASRAVGIEVMLGISIARRRRRRRYILSSEEMEWVWQYMYISG